MATYRRAMGHEGGNRLTIGIVAVVAVLLLVLMLAERGLFTSNAINASGMALPGVTLSDDEADRMPVVTSVRSDGEAERVGIRAGDEIQAVDGHPVRDVAALRAALMSGRAGERLALHIRRGDALWTVALDRAEPSAGDQLATDR